MKLYNLKDILNLKKNGQNEEKLEELLIKERRRTI